MLSPHDQTGFFADRDALNLDDYILFTYRFETDLDPRLAAASLACEQSTAQWQRPGIAEDLRHRFGAKIIQLKQINQSLYEIVVAHPHTNFGPKIPNLLSVAAGEGPFYCPGIEKIQWTDVEFPLNYLTQFKGPQFGVQGIRDQLGIQDRPLFIGVVKPNIGLSSKNFAQIAFEAFCGGLDIAKDDEMLADAEYSSSDERSEQVLTQLKQAEQHTGQKKWYLANITDEIENILKLYEHVAKKGAQAVMINSIFTGLSALRMLRNHSQLPIFSHFTGLATFSRITNFGIHSLVFIKLQRLLGADAIIMPGFGSRMRCRETEVLQNVEACLKPWGPLKPSLPVPGGSDWAGTLPKLYQLIGHADFGFIAGRGIFGHPDGPSAGAQSLHQAWEAVQNQKTLKDWVAQKQVQALQKAIEAFS